MGHHLGRQGLREASSRQGWQWRVWSPQTGLLPSCEECQREYPGSVRVFLSQACIDIKIGSFFATICRWSSLTIVSVFLFFCCGRRLLTPTSILCSLGDAHLLNRKVCAYT